MRRSSSTIAVVALGAALVAQPAQAAQQFRYFGRATAAAAELDTITADVGAGGKDDKGNVIDHKECDAEQVTCFDETGTAGAIPGVLLTGTAHTIGGARTPTGQLNAGFPRVESTAQASLVLIPDALSVAIAPTTAIADSASGELTAVGGPVVIVLAGTPIEIPSGQGIELPGLLTLLPMRTSQLTRDGIAIIKVDGAILVPDPSGPIASVGPVVLGHAEAGIEEPFTEGGGGAGSCSLSRSGKDSGGWQLLFVIGLLGWIAMRRRVAVRPGRGQAQR